MPRADSNRPAGRRPCLHPRADHQHGTVGAYRADGCRCEPCSVANDAARRSRAQQRMNDSWSPFTPAAPVREHLNRLRTAGVGVDRIARLANVPGSTVREIIYGSSGRMFRQVRATTAARLLATIPETKVRSERSTVDASDTRTLIGSLRTRGMGWHEIADELGRSASSLQRSLKRPTVTVKTAADVAQLCQALGTVNRTQSGPEDAR